MDQSAQIRVRSGRHLSICEQVKAKFIKLLFDCLKFANVVKSLIFIMQKDTSGQRNATPRGNLPYDVSHVSTLSQATRFARNTENSL